ncbi:MAG: tRNA preQ1(34) S-adenosylmethionine ribosyltransferase-isomerase QueA [Candidatus Omnitrophota bacterium]
MKLSEFDYKLPETLIAQEPLRDRENARLMVLDRSLGKIEEKAFHEICAYIGPEDCLVLNDTRVIPARLFAERKTGGRVEIFLLDTESELPRALIRPSKRVKEGEELRLEGGIKATVLGSADAGRFIKFNASIDEVLKLGHVPLPPYIKREDIPRDREDYQTVYARKEGATASPTAGLHFTRELINVLGAKGVSIVYVTLHTSYGTFAPIESDTVEEHRMHAEYYEIDELAANVINITKSYGGRIFAVGTTSSRVLESVAVKEGEVAPSNGETDLFIYPGYQFKVVDGMITNFHLPKSTLLMLVSAFAGKDLIFEAYKKAVRGKYRFFSYGDAMLII